MADLKKQKHKQQQISDARKAQRGGSLPQKNLQEEEDDDDASGGGPGKRKQKGFKLEKLLSAISEGRRKAKRFWRVLAKEGLDISDTKKSELSKQKEKSSKVNDKTEKVTTAETSEKEVKKATDRALEERESKGDKEFHAEKSGEAKPAWEKAKAADSASKRQFGLDKSIAADTSAKAATGAFLQGSNGIRDGNYNGAAVQVDLDGQLSGTARSYASTAQNSVGIWGAGTNASKMANHQGLGAHTGNASGVASHLFDAGRGTQEGSAAATATKTKAVKASQSPAVGKGR